MIGRIVASMRESRAPRRGSETLVIQRKPG